MGNHITVLLLVKPYSPEELVKQAREQGLKVYSLPPDGQVDQVVEAAASSDAPAVLLIAALQDFETIASLIPDASFVAPLPSFEVHAERAAGAAPLDFGAERDSLLGDPRFADVNIPSADVDPSTWLRTYTQPVPFTREFNPGVAYAGGQK